MTGTTLPRMTIADEDGPITIATEALASMFEVLAKDKVADDWNIHLLVCGVERTFYGIVEHPSLEEQPDLDPHWLPTVVEQLCFGESATGFALALQVPLVPGVQTVVGLAYESTGQTWGAMTIAGHAVGLPIIAPQMREDCDAVGRRLWGAAWEPTCVGHDHEHD